MQLFIGILVIEIIYWTRLKWYLVFKWLTGYPFVNVVLQILWWVNHRSMVIGWNILSLRFWFDLEITVTHCRK